MEVIANIISKVLSSSSKTAGVLFIASAIIYYAYYYKFDSLSELTPSHMLISNIIGVISGVMLVINLFLVILRAFKIFVVALFKKFIMWQAIRTRRNRSLMNLDVGYSEYLEVVSFCYSNNIVRFPARRDNPLLSNMKKAFILEDDPTISPYDSETFFTVNPTISNYLSSNPSLIVPTTSTPPWKASDRRSWMAV